MRIINPAIIFIIFLVASCKQGKSVNHDEQLEQENEIDEEYLIAMLDSIWTTEQEPIRLRDSLGKVHGYESEAFQKQNEIYHKNHGINEKKILNILDTQGWPSKNIIGEQGNLTICNVLQHSGVEVRKKYLSMMKKAVVIFY